MTNATTPESLRRYIEEERQDLERYVSKDNAMQTIIDLKNRKLADLIAIHNSWPANVLAYADYWIKAEQFISRVQRDTGVGSVLLILNIREDGSPAIITLNEL